MDNPIGTTPEQIPPQPPISTQVTNRLPWIKVLLLILIVSIPIGIGGYVLGIRKNQPVPQKQQITTAPIITQSPPAANWKTYTNGTYGYSLKYDHDSSNGKRIIHVYKQLSDHTATFNWYDVDKVTGQVTKEVL